MLNRLIQQQKDLRLAGEPVDIQPLQAIASSIEHFREIVKDPENDEDPEPPRKRARYANGESSVTSSRPDEELGNRTGGKDDEEQETPQEEPPVMPQNMSTWSHVLRTSAQRARITHAQHAVLMSLRFRDMRSRESNIHDAYKNTCNWVVETNHSDQETVQTEIPLINRWLSSGKGVFWLAGKAGSGKSTLMKHVTRQTNLEKLLGRWTYKRKIVICSFFFWHSGTKLQKSQEGLLRTLFYQIFHSCPDLIQRLLPERFHDTDASNDWLRMDLLELLRRFVALDFPETAFCLFIDGLDECGEDPMDLIEILQDIDNPSIKMCLASRPWNCFQEAFGKDKAKTIRLEEHNRGDILHFVNDTITNCSGFLKLRHTDPECGSLITEIADKAQGVFLWVFLVTRSLMRGLVNGDSFHTLRLRLKTFPPELEPYFMKMFKSIEPVYLQETSELLQTSVSATEPYPTMLYQALLEPDLDAYEARCEAIFSELDIDAFLIGLEQTKKRVNARCQDLLETVDCPPAQSISSNQFTDAYHGSKVDFLHRTVSDFLRTPEMKALLKEHAGEGFDPQYKVNKSFQIILRLLEGLN